MKIDAAFIPAEVVQARLQRSMVVVIDVLRASTSIITALDNDCDIVIPASDAGEAIRIARAFATEKVLLCGEQNGRRIAGFALGNSPQEFEASAIRGRTIVFTSTNSTRLFRLCQQAEAVYVGALVNAAAVVSALRTSRRDVLLLCAANEGRFAWEDAYCAGMLVERLRSVKRGAVVLSDAAKAAVMLFEQSGTKALHVLRACDHGRYLASIGFESDLSVCAAIDYSASVPLYAEGVIHQARGDGQQGAMK